MAIHVGILSLDGHTAPATGAVQSRESETSIGIEEERGTSGEWEYAVPHKYSRKEVTINGVGDAELSLVTAGAITRGTLKVISARQGETGKGLPKFTRRGVVLNNLA